MQRPVQSAFQSIEPFELLPNQLSAKMQVSNGFERMVSNGFEWSHKLQSLYDRLCDRPCDRAHRTDQDSLTAFNSAKRIPFLAKTFVSLDTRIARHSYRQHSLRQHLYRQTFFEQIDFCLFRISKLKNLNLRQICLLLIETFASLENAWPVWRRSGLV